MCENKTLMNIFNLVNKTSIAQNFFSIFISFLYVFRTTMCPSSGETALFMRHLVLVILCGWLDWYAPRIPDSLPYRI